MEYMFYIKGIKPISINSTHFGAEAGYRKKPATIAWEKRLRSGFRPFSSDIKKFRKTFDPSKHVVSRQYIFFFPETDFYTAKNEKSITTKDVSNVSTFPDRQILGEILKVKDAGHTQNNSLDKLPDDVVFNKVLKVDDKYIQRGSVELVPWNKTFNGLLTLIKIEDHQATMERSLQWCGYLDRRVG